MFGFRVTAIVAVFFVAVVHQIVSPQMIQSPGVPCVSDDQCKPPLLPKGAECDLGFCMCKNNEGKSEKCSMSHSQPRSAVVTAPAARLCTLDHECGSNPNVFCNTTIRQCDCKDHYVMSNTDLSCLPISKSVGASCVQDEQCAILNSTCRNNQCVCRAGFHYAENSCWKTVEIGKSCMTSQECSHVSGAVCNDRSICACATDTVLNDDGRRCLLVVKTWKGECVEPIQCSKTFTGAQCIEKQCNCEDNSHFEPSLNGCVATKQLGESCSVNYECHQEMEDDKSAIPQSCIEKICTCNENFTKDGNKCVRSGGSSLVSSFLSIVVLLSVLLFARS